MAQEEQNQRCSNSSSASGGGGCEGGAVGSSRSSNKQKQKKVPQRGLGVAQLEKIRLEEQQKKDASVALVATTPPFLSPPTNVINSPYLPPPNYHHHQNQSSCSSIPIPLPTDLCLPNSLLKPPQSVHGMDVLSSITLPLPNPVGWPAISVRGHGNVPKAWNTCEFGLEKENVVVDPGLAFQSSLSLPYESNPIWPPLQGLLPKTIQQYQQTSSSVNVPSETSSSGLNIQIEPPSNQSFYNNYLPLWPEEDKMVGMKRSYPFSLDNPSCSFYPKLPSISHPNTRSDESASFGNECRFDVEPGTHIFREGPSCSMPIPEPNSKESKRENGVFCGDFLTLAPPVATSTSPRSKLKHPPAYLAYRNSEKPDFASLPYQECGKDPVSWLGAKPWNQRQQFYSFLPAAKMHTGQATTRMNNCNGGEAGESVDLNLKL